MLNRFIQWIISLFVHETIEQIKEEVNKPNTMTDEKPDTKLQDALNADLTQRLHNKQSSNPAEWGSSSGE